MCTSQYDFDRIIDRHHTSCVKYDGGPCRIGRDDLLPLWIADMDFSLPSEILDDLHARIDHGIFGYTDPDDEYFAALNQWFGTRHGYTIDPETVTLGCGVVYGLATCVRAFTQPGDAVIIQQPVYNPFRAVIEQNKRVLVNSELVYQDGKYSIDFDDFEQKIIDHQVKLFILCNPHNPVGRVWTRAELEQLADICLRHNVLIVSDEIHCDIIFEGHTFVSCLALGDTYQPHVIVHLSPSKTFNVAGFQPSNVVIPNPELRARYREVTMATGYSQGSLMGQVAIKSCYTKGARWADALLVYIQENVAFATRYFEEHFSRAHVVKPQGTYLLWVDFSAYGLTDDELEGLIVNKAKLWLNSGKIFGDQSTQFERFNLACPRAVLKQALDQLYQAFIDAELEIL